MRQYLFQNLKKNKCGFYCTARGFKEFCENSKPIC